MEDSKGASSGIPNAPTSNSKNPADALQNKGGSYKPNVEGPVDSRLPMLPQAPQPKPYVIKGQGEGSR